MLTACMHWKADLYRMIVYCIGRSDNDSFVCQDIPVNSSEQSVTVHEGDVLGACVDHGDGFDMVSETDGHSLTVIRVGGMMGCSDMKTMEVTVKNSRSSMQDQESMQLHLYAVIGKHNKM